MEYNRSSPFEEVEFQTKEEAIAYRESQKKASSISIKKNFKSY
nr:MAG TPA: ETC complex I subunit conserved region [Caudoviricetes sp.]